MPPGRQIQLAERSALRGTSPPRYGNEDRVALLLYARSTARAARRLDVRCSLVLLAAAVLLTGCGKTKKLVVEPSPIVTAPRGKVASYVTRDPADFPKMASHLAFNFGDGTTNARFALNVIRGCDPLVADRSYAINPKQVNFIVPGMLDGYAGSPPCGNEYGFAVTYGNGYQHSTVPLDSPYPGIGTIRPFKSAAGKDIPSYADGTRIYSETNWVLNMSSFGTDDSTAEWAARVKAHWALADLGGPKWRANHPGVQGVWGDNFIWYEPYFESNRSPDGARPGMTGRQWDDGAVRNFTKLHSILGPDMLLGANGVGSACGFGDVYAGSDPGADCSLGDATMWEGYGGTNYTHDPSNFDGAIEQFSRWMSVRPNGRARYGIVTQYGTCGTNNVGHPLTAQDERIALALATIGGVDLWAVHDCNWGTTVVPGGAVLDSRNGRQPGLPARLAGPADLWA